MSRDNSTHPMRAALAMVGAMAIIGVIDNYVVRVAAEIGLWQFYLIRALLALPLVAGLSWLGLGQLRAHRLWAVALRSLLVSVAMLFYFSALALMPIAQALAGLFTSPIFILLVTSLGMRRYIGPWRVLAVAVGFAGILLVLQPDPGDFDFSVLIPVAGGFFYALGAMTTRALCARESTISLLAGMLLMQALIGAIGLAALGIAPLDSVAGPEGFVVRGWVWPMGGATIWVLVQAVGSVAGVFLIIKAYQLGEPSYVSVFEYSVMIFGPLFAFVVLGQSLGLWQMAGVALIVAAGGIIALREK
jgi:drug/metabolite transporter (DMT)-like permease